MQRICVFCGTNPGSRPEYGAAARGLGKILADQGIELVYGGASVGIMGELADAVHEHGGHVTGIIPQQLMEKEAAHTGIPNLIVVASMHQRKSQMADMSDGFIALPGGIGTLEELVEQMTWAQLGRHKKPILIANIRGFWDPLCALLDHMRKTAFIRPSLPIDLLVADKIEDILPKLHGAATPLPREVENAKAAETIDRM